MLNQRCECHECTQARAIGQLVGPARSGSGAQLMFDQQRDNLWAENKRLSHLVANQRAELDDIRAEHYASMRRGEELYKPIFDAIGFSYVSDVVKEIEALKRDRQLLGDARLRLSLHGLHAGQPEEKG